MGAHLDVTDFRYKTRPVAELNFGFAVPLTAISRSRKQPRGLVSKWAKELALADRGRKNHYDSSIERNDLAASDRWHQWCLRKAWEENNCPPFFTRPRWRRDKWF